MNKFKDTYIQSWGDEGSIFVSFKKVVFIPHSKKKKIKEKKY
jgi:hypothetical protein